MKRRKNKRFGKLPWSAAAGNLPAAFEAIDRERERCARWRRERGYLPDGNVAVPPAGSDAQSNALIQGRDVVVPDAREENVG